MHFPIQKFYMIELFSLIVFILYIVRIYAIYFRHPTHPSDPAKLPQELTFLEFFAGAGNVWRAMRADSVAAIGVDIEYANPDPGDQNPFDILSHAGMALGSKFQEMILRGITKNHWCETTEVSKTVAML